MHKILGIPPSESWAISSYSELHNSMRWKRMSNKIPEILHCCVNFSYKIIRWRSFFFFLWPTSGLLNMILLICKNFWSVFPIICLQAGLSLINWFLLNRLLNRWLSIILTCFWLRLIFYININLSFLWGKLYRWLWSFYINFLIGITNNNRRC